MILDNLVEPQWILVDCDKPFLGDVLCSVKDDSSYLVEKSILNLFCPKYSVLINKTCYTFSWINTKMTLGRTCTTGKKIKDIDLKRFKVLFDAISVVFPRILSPDFNFVLSYQRYSNIYKYEKQVVKNNSAEGIYISSEHLMLISKGDNTFKCENGTFISQQYVCDGIANCPGYQPLDEMGCHCHSDTKENYSGKCKWIINPISKTTICSGFYFLSVDGTCTSYQFTAFNSNLRFNKTVGMEFIKCANGKIIHNDLADDLVAHCTPENQDKIHVIKMLHNRTHFQCKEANQLPCLEGHSKCYTISDTCIYQLDHYFHLMPCRTGGHLENCKEFECNMMFKCPNYYCIPWNYVCDGKWDCPKGTDEGLTHGCNIDRKCPNLFKCRKSNLCIHLGSLCNNDPVCPHGDDELLCDLQNQICPFYCHCFLHTIRCINVTLNSLFASALWPYNVVLFDNCIHYVGAWLNRILFNVRIFVHTHSGLQEVCSLTNGKIFLSADFSFNIIGQLQSGCFLNMNSIKLINLKSNLISEIQKLAFSGLPSLRYLDLSNNFLTSISEYIFARSHNIVILSLTGNGLMSVNKNTFQKFKGKIINVRDFHICCLIPKTVHCTATIPWHKSCSNLLWHTCITKFIGFISCLLIFLNLLSIIIQNISVRDKSSHSFSTIVIAINLGGLTMGTYLLVIWMFDLYYSRIFVMYERKWLTSFQCYILHSVVLNFYLLSPLMQCFLSFIRLMVTLYPMNTRYRYKTFVLRGIICIWLFTGILSIFKTVLMYINSIPIPFKLCISFVDPAHSFSYSNILLWAIFLYYVTICFSILGMHLKLCQCLRISQIHFGLSDKRKKSNAQILMQIFVITLSCLLSWLPSNIVFAVVTFKEKYPVELIIWIIVAVMPINSLVGPVIFITTNFKRFSEHSKLSITKII